MEKRNFNSIDLCKIIMAVIVVAIHTEPFANCSNNIVLSIYSSITSFAVPFFFLASGFFLADKMNLPLSSPENCNITKKYLIRIIKLYILWTIIYLPMTIIGFINEGEGIVKSMLVFVRGFVFIGEQYYSWQLWYLLSLVYAILFLFILQKAKAKIKTIVIITIIFFCFKLFVSWIVEFDKDLPSLLLYFKKIILLTTTSGRTLAGPYYLIIGVLLNKKPTNKILGWIMLVIGFIISVFVKDTVITSILNVIKAVGLFTVVSNTNIIGGKIFYYLRKTSTYIYFVHMYVWVVLTYIIFGEIKNGVIPFIITLAGSIGVSTIIIFVKSRIKRRN